MSERNIDSTTRFVPALLRMDHIKKLLRREEIFDTRLVEEVHHEPPHYMEPIAKEASQMARARLFRRVSDVAQGQKKLKISSITLREALDHLKRTFGEQLLELVFDEAGNTKLLINIFVNKKHLNQLRGLDTEISDEDEVLIIPAIAGG